MIYFTTKAYNAEKTLPRAIESVLGNTCGDFAYHLCDNGSTDGTGDIVRDYAARDKRVVPFFNARNQEWTPDAQKNVLDLARHLGSDDWLCVLDADDDYAPTFLEEMLRFVKAHDLDYAACRSNFVDDASGAVQNEYVLEKDIVIEDEGFGTLFPDYFRFMGARWGKLQSGGLFGRVDFAALDLYLAGLALSHRFDTATMLWYLRYSQRAGVLARPLHNYRLCPQSHHMRGLEDKVRDNHKMPNVYREFLAAKAGRVSPENERYIGEVFERSMRRTLSEKGA
jgi:glycosyltransferase involved in cell wall biosynthesis